NGGSPVLFDGSLFSTRKQPAKKKQTLPLLVLLVFSVYVSLSKNALLRLLTPRIEAKADAKVRLFSETPNFF
ncbi:MAG: hypothetical protein IJ144_02220, partial [Prevotella sp.]|nr:hypothetical protein [Prevotella sp.]